MVFQNEDEITKYINEKYHKPDFIRGKWDGFGYYHIKIDREHSNRHGWESVAYFIKNDKKIEEIKEEIKDLINKLNACVSIEFERYYIYDWINGKYLSINGFCDEEWVDTEDAVWSRSRFDKDTAQKIISRNEVDLVMRKC